MIKIGDKVATQIHNAYKDKFSIVTCFVRQEANGGFYGLSATMDDPLSTWLWRQEKDFTKLEEEEMATATKSFPGVGDFPIGTQVKILKGSRQGKIGQVTHNDYSGSLPIRVEWPIGSSFVSTNYDWYNIRDLEILPALPGVGDKVNYLRTGEVTSVFNDGVYVKLDGQSEIYLTRSELNYITVTEKAEKVIPLGTQTTDSHGCVFLYTEDENKNQIWLRIVSNEANKPVGEKIKLNSFSGRANSDRARAAL